MKEFKALLVEENGTFSKSVTTRSIDDLPEGDTLIHVKYSSLNYKDALSASGNKGVSRNFPHTPGIDAVGVIESTTSNTFKAGDEVIVTSYDLGMNTSGGFGEYIRVPADWVVKLPQGLSMKEAMMLGTAGLTAGMSVLRLTELVKPEAGKIIVSGATGGVGSMSVAILAKMGYEVAAITGKESEADFLKSIGATEVISRAAFEGMDNKPMLRTNYAGGIDTVGGVIMENMIKSTSHMGVVTCCGNVASPKFSLTVFPFILRGVSLIGIESQNYPMHYREQVWAKLADEWKPAQLEAMCEEVSLDGISEKIDLILKGQIKGRVVLKL